MSSPIRTAVVGFGTAGSVFHAPLIAADPSFELTAIVTSSPERQRTIAGSYPDTAVYPSVDVLLERCDELDLIVVGTPNNTHAAIARSAIDHGVNVLIDKPIAVTSTEATALVTAADAAGVALTVFQNRRWDGDFLTVREVIASGALGEIRQFDSAFEWWSPTVTGKWKDTATAAGGGGMLYDLGPHLIDQAIQLFGPIDDMHAELDSRRRGAVADDDAFVSLHHVNGVRSRLWMSAIAPQMRDRFRVVGSLRTITFTGLDPQEPQLIEGIRPGDPGYGLHTDGRRAVLAGADETREVPIRAGDYPEFYRRLAAALAHGAPLPVDPRDSIAVLDLIERIGESR